MLRSVVQVHP